MDKGFRALESETRSLPSKGGDHGGGIGRGEVIGQT